MPERRGVSRKTVIDAAKEKVSVVELAKRLGTRLRPSGKDLRGPCPIHGGTNPTSFAVDPEQGVWFCNSCLVGGDVVELARFAWGYEKHEVAMAAADLLHEFGHPIPERPARWFAKQQRQRAARAAVEGAKVQHAQRRVFRTFLPMLEEIEDEDERREEAEYLWDSAGEIAALIVGGRSS